MISNNSLTTVSEYPCPTHRRQRLTHLCTDFRCSSSPFLCGMCFVQQSNRINHTGHEQSLLPIGESIPQLAMIIDGSKLEMQRLFSSTIGRSEPLLKKIESPERHYAQVDTHIKSLKAQLDGEFDRLLGDFQKRVTAGRQSIFLQLDAYQKQYVQNMQAYRQLIEPLLAFNRRYKYYANANNLSLKLFSEIKRRSSEWYVDLKRTMTLSTRIIDRPQVIYDGLTKSTQFMSQSTEELPQLRTSDKLGAALQKALSDSIGELLVLRELKPLGSHLLDSSERVNGQAAQLPTIPPHPPQMMHNPNHNTRLVIR